MSGYVNRTLMDKHDKKYLIWFLIAMAIAILPWFIIWVARLAWEFGKIGDVLFVEDSQEGEE